MTQRLALISLVVADYDDAIAFYTQKLGFTLEEDTPLSDTKRWVRVAPPGGAAGCQLLLAQASTPAQHAAVGIQTGGRVFLFLHTDDFKTAHQRLIDQKVEIVRPATVEPYGTVLVFADLYGNLWDLIQPSS